jgi:hypothetical protein
LVEGKTIPYIEPAYLRCKQSLADDIERIANFIHEKRLDVVLIDSLGQAAGSDKFDSSGKGSALRFFECLRQLNVTSLIIAQNAKGEAGTKTIYGSTYFTYYARNIFELRRSKEAGQDELSVALFHQEGNYTHQYEPTGLRIKYTDTSISFSGESVNLSQFLDKVSQSALVGKFLTAGAQNLTAIHRFLQTHFPKITSNQVSVILNRMKKRGEVVELGSGMWGLAAHTEDTPESS